jgi:fructuronate reductase
LAFAYLGYLAGHEFIYQVAAQPDYVAYMRRLMREEVAPTLKLPAGVDVAAYQDALVERFGNPPRRTARNRLRWTFAEAAAAHPAPCAIISIRAGRSIACARRRGMDAPSRHGRIDEIRVSDPLSEAFARIAAASRGDPAALAHGLLGLRAIFAEDLPADPRFAGRVTAWLEELFATGAKRTVAHAAREPASASHLRTGPDPPFPAPRSPVFVRARATCAGARAVRNGEGPADREPAWSHRSAVVCRQRAI